MDRSREHHWWPVTLQAQWATLSGDLNWIEPDGQIKTKKFYNKKVAKKSHGHTVLRGSSWQYNFEREFSEADDCIPTIVSFFRSLAHPLGGWRPAAQVFRKLWNDGLKFENFGIRHSMPERIERQFLNLAASLLWRSPAQRHIYSKAGVRLGIPYDEETGKVNLIHHYGPIKKRILTGLRPRKAYIVLRSWKKEFFCGDGYCGSILPDIGPPWRMLLPLTPDICIYMFSPSTIAHENTIFCTTALDSHIDRINEITQVVSRDHLFFRRDTPQLVDAYRQRIFFNYRCERDWLLQDYEKLYPDSNMQRSFRLRSG